MLLHFYHSLADSSDIIAVTVERITTCNQAAWTSVTHSQWSHWCCSLVGHSLMVLFHSSTRCGSFSTTSQSLFNVGGVVVAQLHKTAVMSLCPGHKDQQWRTRGQLCPCCLICGSLSQSEREKTAGGETVFKNGGFDSCVDTLTNQWMAVGQRHTHQLSSLGIRAERK